MPNRGNNGVLGPALLDLVVEDQSLGAALFSDTREVFE